MPALDWSQCPAAESIPGKVSGAWVLRGTRTRSLEKAPRLRIDPRWMRTLFDNGTPRGLARFLAAHPV